VTSSPFPAFIRSLLPDTLQIFHTPKTEQASAEANHLKYKYIYLSNLGVVVFIQMKIGLPINIISVNSVEHILFKIENRVLPTGRKLARSEMIGSAVGQICSWVSGVRCQVPVNNKS